MGEVIYNMSLVGRDAKLLTEVVNQGIDSRLQAVTESSFEWKAEYIGNIVVTKKLKCRVSPKDLVVILRRLDELDGDDALHLMGEILESLNMPEAYFVDDYETLTYYDHGTNSYVTGDPTVMITKELLGK